MPLFGNIRSWLFDNCNYIVGPPVGPIRFSIAYTDTQFVFIWKAPSTSTIVLNWGDGSKTSVAGQDGTLITSTSNYFAPGTYNFWITGDALDITHIYISKQLFVSGDISGWGVLTNLAFIAVSGTGMYGDISGLNNFPAGTYLQAALSNVTFDNVVDWVVNYTVINLNGVHFTSEMVDNALNSFDDLVGTNLYLSSMAPRTVASDAAMVSIIGNNCLVVCNEDASAVDLGEELYTLSNAIAIATETDATTGWTATGLGAPNVFESQSVKKAVGDYAFHVNANPNPTAGCNITLATPLTVDADAYYRIAFSFGHWESWYHWVVYIWGTTHNYVYANLTDFPTQFQTWVAYTKSPDTTMELSIREGSDTNDGEIYIDNLSIKKVI